MAKKGISTKKNKAIITKGPLDRLVADGWMLDNDLKSITGFNWVIDLIDHFSKFLMSIQLKNNMKWIYKKLFELILSCELISFLLATIIFNYSSKLHLIHLFISIKLLYIYL